MILLNFDLFLYEHYQMTIKKYRSNFERVEQLMHDVTMRDEMRAFQSPVRGQDIMKELNLKPSKQVGDIKKMIEEAILDGHIENNYEDAFQYMKKIKSTILIPNIYLNIKTIF